MLKRVINPIWLTTDLFGIITKRKREKEVQRAQLFSSKQKINLIFCFIVFHCFSCVSLKTQKELSGEYYNLGNDYFDLENYTRAIELYTKAIGYDENNHDAKINLIMAYQNNKKFEEAEKMIIQEYEEKNTEYNKKLIILLGKNYFLLNNFNGAINTFKKFTESYPSDSSGFYNFGLSLLKIGDSLGAIDNFLKSYELDKTFLPTLYNISNYYYNRKEYAEALPYIAELVQKESNNDITMYMYAKILYELNEYENARDAIKKCYEKDSKNSEYYLFAAKIYARGFEDKKNTLYFIERALENGYKASELSNVEEFSVVKESYKNEYNDLLKKYIK